MSKLFWDERAQGAFRALARVAFFVELELLAQEATGRVGGTAIAHEREHVVARLVKNGRIKIGWR